MDLDSSTAYTVGEDFGSRQVLRFSVPPGAPDPYDLLSGAARPRGPLSLAVDEGRHPADWLGTTEAVLAVVSPRLQQVLRQVGARGWDTWPVDVPGHPELAGWAGLVVTGRAGRVRDDLAERFVAPALAPGGEPWPSLRGLVVEPGSWDGSEVFLPEGTAHVCVTAPVRDALVEAGVTGCVFERMSDVVTPVLDA